MSEAKLKPCPFCGKTNKLDIDHLSKNDEVADDWCVECDRCRFSQHAVHMTKQDAIAAWNTRVDPVKDEMYAALKALIGTLGTPDGYFPTAGKPITDQARKALAKAEGHDS